MEKEMLIFCFIALVSFIFGILLIKVPEKLFEIQRKFYASLNWRIEPISWEKEMKSMRWMGMILLAVVLFSAWFFVKARFF